MHKELLQFRNGVPPKYGAIWLTYYPHIMVEWYPHVLTVSTLHPMGPNKTLNMVEFYYHKACVLAEENLVIFETFLNRRQDSSSLDSSSLDSS